MSGGRLLATLLIDGWDVATIAKRDGWGVDYTVRDQIDWGEPALPFAGRAGQLAGPDSISTPPDQWRVIDGDTVARSDGPDGGEEEFRLLGLDCPELSKVRKGSLQKWRGEKAAERLRWHIGRALSIKMVPGPADDGNVMHHNRRFGRLYLDEVDVAEIAIEEGWGVKWDRDNRVDWDDPAQPFNIQIIDV